MEIVSALEAALVDKVGRDRFDVWFAGNTRLAVEDDELVVTAASQFYQDWLRSHFRRDLEAISAEVVGRPLVVAFRIDPALVQSTKESPPAPSGGVPGMSNAKTRVGNAIRQRSNDGRARDGSGNNRRTLPRRPLSALDAFVVGPSNCVAHTSAHATAQRLGSVSPLVFYGPTGVGKTHLLEGVLSSARERHPGLRGVYLSAEQFTASFVEATQGRGMPNFRRKYRDVELLLIDDLQFFAGKRGTLAELLHTLDALHRDGRQVVFAADRAPAELTGLGNELIARLQAGLVCRLDPPEQETRFEIVQREATRLELTLPDEVAHFVADSFRNHARELTGALVRIKATGEAWERPLTLELAQEALSELVQQASRAVRLPDVERAVCEVLGVDVSSLQSQRRDQAASHARMLAMWLARKHTRAAFSEIGQYFGRRSHATAISANKKVGVWMSDHATVRLADRAWDVADAVRRVEQRLLTG